MSRRGAAALNRSNTLQLSKPILALTYLLTFKWHWSAVGRRGRVARTSTPVPQPPGRRARSRHSDCASRPHVWVQDGGTAQLKLVHRYAVRRRSSHGACQRAQWHRADQGVGCAIAQGDCSLLPLALSARGFGTALPQREAAVRRGLRRAGRHRNGSCHQRAPHTGCAGARARAAGTAVRAAQRRGFRAGTSTAPADGRLPCACCAFVAQVDYGLATIKDARGSTIAAINRAGEVSGHTGARCAL